jgi:hypothetical protein
MSAKIKEAAKDNTKLTDFEGLKEVVIHYSVLRKAKPATFKVTKTQNTMLVAFL